MSVPPLGLLLVACDPEVRRIDREIFRCYRAEDDAYDEETRGGRTQGVVWPPRTDRGVGAISHRVRWRVSRKSSEGPIRRSSIQGKSAIRFLAMCLAASIFGCSGGENGSEDDSIAGRQVEQIHIEPDFPLHDTREVLRVGSSESGQPSFYAVRDIERRADGTFVVLNGRRHELLWIDSTGTLTRSRGGEGDGPGEFRRPGGLWVTQDGAVHVADPGTERVTSYDPTGELTEVMRVSGFPSTSLRVLGLLDRATVILSDESVSMPVSAIVSGGAYTDTIALARLDPGAATVETVRTMPGVMQTAANDGGSVSARYPEIGWAYDVGPEGLYVAPPNQPEIRIENPPGEVRAILRFPGPAGEGWAEPGAFRRRDVLVGPEGRLWTRGFLEAAGEARDDSAASDSAVIWHVLESSGRPVGRVALPSDFRPMAAWDLRVAGIERDALGRESLVVFEVAPAFP